MSSEDRTVIEVRGVGKRYRKGRAENYRTLRDTVMAGIKSLVRRREACPAENPFWALKDVSFTLRKGTILGVIGRNGAGKSTLLKILSRITAPTEGDIVVHGRIGSLLEVGTGFHPELTGYENIFLNGAILGMRRGETERKIESIVKFAEVDEFLHTPVKRYSSGMYMRLAFAVAAHLEPDVVLVDEVLAVGDAAFQKKCLDKMAQLASEGRTIIIVSHNLASIERLCGEAILLEKGRIERRGPAGEVVRHYLEHALPSGLATPVAERTDRTGNGRIRFTSFHLEDASGRVISRFQSGMEAVLVFGFRREPGSVCREVEVGFSFYSPLGDPLFVFYNSYSGEQFDDLPETGFFRCRLKRLPLAASRYRVAARLAVAGEEADWPRDGIGFVDVEPGNFYGTGYEREPINCHFLVDGSWSMESPR